MFPQFFDAVLKSLGNRYCALTSVKSSISARTQKRQGAPRVPQVTDPFL